MAKKKRKEVPKAALPPVKEFPLDDTEKLHVENIVLRDNNLKLQAQELQMRRNMVISMIRTRLGINPDVQIQILGDKVVVLNDKKPMKPHA